METEQLELWAEPKKPIGTTFNLINNDCMVALKELDDKSIDLVVTDCPYHIVSGGCTTGVYGNEPGGTKQATKRGFGSWREKSDWQEQARIYLGRYKTRGIVWHTKR